MTLQDCYRKFGGDYKDAVSRLMNDRILQKFLLKFLDDGSYDLLIQSLDNSDYEEAFRAAHTMKGICLNLGFSGLADSSGRLTEVLRAGQCRDCDELLAQVKTDYEQTVSAIREFQAGL